MWPSELSWLSPFQEKSVLKNFYEALNSEPLELLIKTQMVDCVALSHISIQHSPEMAPSKAKGGLTLTLREHSFLSLITGKKF